MKLINFLFACLLLLLFSDCAKKSLPQWIGYDESSELIANAKHENPRMQYKLIQSKFSDKNAIWKPIEKELLAFSEQDYERLKPHILEKDILQLQETIRTGKMSYEELTKWYLYRIAKFENNPSTSLHAIIALNKNAIAQAKYCDKIGAKNQHPIYGMPILLKDNINTIGMATTAGALVLKDNQTDDAFIVDRLKSRGAIILGKVNLSEWAYFICSGCPLGYSAIGGQSLNPYGRMKFETGGSSAGSGTSMAANYAVAAVGTETSGSILSPSSQNSVVGLKPTIGLLSRSGIVPISSTLDTPGPMTRNVSDNAILLSAMTGRDPLDDKTNGSPSDINYLDKINKVSLKGIRLGANSSLIENNEIYKKTVNILRENGAQITVFDPLEIKLPGFLSILNIDMKNDLPDYLSQFGNPDLSVNNLSDIVAFNRVDTTNRIPYGQALFEGILVDETSSEKLDTIKSNLENEGRRFFDTPMDEHGLDAILSINNYHAAYAAVAKYPALTVPMGYKENGEPISLTFIAKTFQEDKLLQIGAAYEKTNPIRVLPKMFR